MRDYGRVWLPGRQQQCARGKCHGNRHEEGHLSVNCRLDLPWSSHSRSTCAKAHDMSAVPQPFAPVRSWPSSGGLTERGGGGENKQFEKENKQDTLPSECVPAAKEAAAWRHRVTSWCRGRSEGGAQGFNTWRPREGSHIGGQQEGRDVARILGIAREIGDARNFHADWDF